MGKTTKSVTYSNAFLYKKQILINNIEKAGIYRWINNINKKSYIGSSSNITTRLYKYYSVKYLLNSKRPIDKALLKYGYENFSLEILEYCSKKDLILREQYYLDLKKPEYNILEKAGSTLGFKHNKDTIIKFKKIIISSSTRKNLSKSATGRILSSEDRLKISISRKNYLISPETRRKISYTVTSLIGISVSIKNINNNITTNFKSLAEASKFIGVTRTSVKKALLSGKLIKNCYYVNK